MRLSHANIMVKVYAIKNNFNIEIYIGMSKDPGQILKQHNAGTNRYTKAFAPWELFYTEEYEDYAQARKREIELKKTSGKRFLHAQINMQ